jgi:hypothetical protein
MSANYNSNCSTLSVGCYLYSGPGLTNPVSNGYYSDGSNCYTVTGGSGYISSVDVCTAYVIIDTYTPYTMTCYSFYNFAAEATTNVDTNVDVEIIWYGDLGGSVIGTVTISSGTACNTVEVATGGSIDCLGENISSISVALDPLSYGTQIYEVGTNSTGVYPC